MSALTLNQTLRNWQAEKVRCFALKVSLPSFVQGNYGCLSGSGLPYNTCQILY